MQVTWRRTCVLTSELYTYLAQDSEKLKGEVPWELEALSGQMNFFLWLGELGGHH